MKLIEYGVVANDKRGMDARNMSILMNDNTKELMTFLTGGERNTGKIPDALPVISGGTGAITPVGAKRNLEMTTGPNGEVFTSQGSVEVYDNTFKIYGRASNVMAFSKIATGHYRLEGTINWGTTFKTKYPKDDLGNILCGAEIVPIASGIDIFTYKVFAVPGENFHEGVEFFWKLNKEKPIDIPADRFILFNLIHE